MTNWKGSPGLQVTSFDVPEKEAQCLDDFTRDTASRNTAYSLVGMSSRKFPRDST